MKLLQQCEYYADIHQQISPPKERSVDQIVGEIETELKEVVVIQNLNIYIEMFQIYEIFSSVFNFDPKMPENVGVKEDDDKVFAVSCEINRSSI